MASVCYGGTIRMQSIGTDENKSNDFMGEYPYKIPLIYLEGVGESYFPQYCFDWSDDKTIMVRDNLVVEYVRSNYLELLAEDEKGNVVWLDGRTAPYSNCWGGKYLGGDRAAYDYRIVEYDLETLEKKTYKMVLERTTKFDQWDVKRITELYGEDALPCDLTITDNAVQSQTVETTGEFCF